MAIRDMAGDVFPAKFGFDGFRLSDAAMVAVPTDAEVELVSSVVSEDESKALVRWDGRLLWADLEEVVGSLMLDSELLANPSVVAC